MVIETSHAIADVEGESGISEPEDWVRVYRKKHAGDESPLQLSERARLRELEREVRELRMKADFPSKAATYFAGERENAPALTHMCASLEMPKSGFHGWKSRPESATARRRDGLLGHQNLVAEPQD
jgi:transposase